MLLAHILFPGQSSRFTDNSPEDSENSMKGTRTKVQFSSLADKMEYAFCLSAWISGKFAFIHSVARLVSLPFLSNGVSTFIPANEMKRLISNLFMASSTFVTALVATSGSPGRWPTVLIMAWQP